MKLFGAQADALEIEAGTKRRLADEYDAAQERGEVARRADGAALRDHVPGKNKIATAADISLPARKFTKPARSAMPKSAIRASRWQRSAT